MQLPKMFKVVQSFNNEEVDNLEEEIRKQISNSTSLKELKKGAKIAVTAGSRGIDNIPLILRTVIDELKALGAEPFIVPAMGSHGGGQALGQIELLESLGITEESIGAPISKSDETIELGATADGIKAFLDKKAFESDGIFVVNRIKPHTSFRGDIESGLIKMLVIGLGRKQAADHIHQLGVEGLSEHIPKVGQLIIKKAPILYGLAIIENGYEKTAMIKGIEPEDFHKEEKKLLKKAKEYLPILPFEEVDLLIVHEMGKCYSGTGMDTNVIGRVRIKGQEEPTKPDIKRLLVLDLADASHGNANGIGLADFTTEILKNKIDYHATYTNVLATTFFQRAMVPITLKSDLVAITTAIATLGSMEPIKARIVWIPNTLNLAEIWVSESICEKAKTVKGLTLNPESYDFKFKSGALEKFNSKN